MAQEQQRTSQVIIVGARLHPLRDIYHLLLRASWTRAISLLGAVYVVMNLAFAICYWRLGGVANMTPGSFKDAFFFSVQTMATIGYGGMYPQSEIANVLMTIESICGVFVTAIFTGLVFSKFARASARIVFSRNVVIGPHDGVKTLMLRIGNDRNDSVLDARVRCVLTRTVHTAEGKTFYRMVDLKLARDVAPVLARAFVIMHPIDEDSPLFGLTPADYVEQEIEVMVSVSGLDETTMQPVHAVFSYEDPQILHDHRLADVLSEKPNGNIIMDVRRFHDVERI
ncbi:MAG: ion transporter [Polyangiaceae bacterium]|nr:ion transporter [Polyangiaceae bacterium]MCB9606822.1 ion transporter [Polyangiaceae bacterium]